jgi:lipopolysaccharide/colanic/teichoic acid biosynthesis glycosyltransferase
MKRALDLCLAVTALVLLSPVLGIVALWVRIRLGRPVIFRQERPGLGEEPFTLLKFRTMTDERDESGALLPDGERLMGPGRLLRKLSLDELPELFNVLRGDMSLVGPRPLLLRYSPFFTEEERLRFSVLPGITGLAQVSGRNDLSWDERISADVRYVRDRSLLLDLKILALTLWRVLTRHGHQVNPGATMLDFDEERRTRSAEPVRDTGRLITC